MPLSFVADSNSLANILNLVIARGNACFALVWLAVLVIRDDMKEVDSF